MPPLARRFQGTGRQKRPGTRRGFQGAPSIKKSAEQDGGKEDSVKGTQEGFLSRQITRPQATNWDHWSQFAQPVKKPVGFFDRLSAPEPVEGSGARRYAVYWKYFTAERKRPMSYRPGTFR